MRKVADTTRPILKWFSSSWPSCEDHPGRDPVRLLSYRPPLRSDDTGPRRAFPEGQAVAGLVCTKLAGELGGWDGRIADKGSCVPGLFRRARE